MTSLDLGNSCTDEAILFTWVNVCIGTSIFLENNNEIAIVPFT